VLRIGTNQKITDAGMFELAGLKKLTYVSATFTRVSDEGVKKLSEALPGCEVTRLKD
jgi:hypothetical protein